MSFAAAAARLRGSSRAPSAGIEVLKRGVSPRIVSAYVLGSAGRTASAAPNWPARLGLTSAWAYFSVARRHGGQAEPDRSGGG